MTEDQRIAILKLARAIKQFANALEFIPNEIEELNEACDKIESEFLP